MNAVNNLPLPLKIGIPAILLIVLGAAVWFFVLKEEERPIAVQTSVVEQLETSKKVLSNAGVAFEDDQLDNGDFVLYIKEGTEAKAATALKGSGMTTRLELAKPIECPNEPGFTGGPAANDRYDSCKDAAAVQQFLLTAGVLAANVVVKSVESGEFIGPEKTKSVVAQIFPTERMTSEKSAADWASLARALAKTAGAEAENVWIGDGEMMALFDGGSDDGAGSAGLESIATAGGCSSLTGFTDIAEKQAKVRDCYERTISEKLAAMLGGADRFVLTVEVDINGATESETSTTANDEDSTVRQATSTPGSIKTLTLGAVLDSRFVNPREELAVRQTLRTFTNPERGDPAPTTTRIMMDRSAIDRDDAGDATDAAGPAATGADATTAAKATTTGDDAEAPAKRGTSRMLLAAFAVVVIALLTAISLLWRRGQRLAGERERLADEFRNEQRLLEDFAQSNPDDIARDLEQLFKLPAAEPARPTS